MHEPGVRPGHLPAGPGRALQSRLGPAAADQNARRNADAARRASTDGAPPTRTDGAPPARADAAPTADTDGAPPAPRADGTAGPERRRGLAFGPPPPTGVERRRQEAFETAWRFLASRERTEAELIARLERNDVEPQLVEEVLSELREGGYVDDAGFARRFAEDRRNLDGWGAERIARRLSELGIARHHIRQALADGEHDELAAATALLRRRFPTPPETPRELERALGFLVRKGYELELAHDALRRYGALVLDD